MIHVCVGSSRSAFGSSAWHTIRQLTFISIARRAISGWSPQMTMEFFPENSKFSFCCGSAIDTSPLTRSTRYPASLMTLPSSTFKRLKIGRFSA